MMTVMSMTITKRRRRSNSNDTKLESINAKNLSAFSSRLLYTKRTRTTKIVNKASSISNCNIDKVAIDLEQYFVWLKKFLMKQLNCINKKLNYHYP